MVDLFVEIIEVVVVSVIIALMLLAAFAFVINVIVPSKSINARLRKFFGTQPNSLPIVRHVFHVVEFPSVQLAVSQFLKEKWHKQLPLGIGASSLQQAIVSDTQVTPVVYREIDIDIGEKLQCAANALHLVNDVGERLAVHVQLNEHRGEVIVEAMSPSREAASQALQALRDAVARRQVYRGKVLTPGSSETYSGESGWAAIKLLELPLIERSQIILPEATLELIDRNAIRFFEHVELLRRVGQPVKRGLLFHGPPGTGKTFAAQWIARNARGTTVLFLSGEHLHDIKACCRIARLLAPAIVVLEDVDLIAVSRDVSSQTTSLHQLLNEMDGVGIGSEILFLLTTNRPEVLESALADRPGRVDQAIEFPLPDADCRTRLFQLYARQLDTGEVDWSRIVDCTEAASPAFIKELVRKATLYAVDMSSVDAFSVRLTTAHFESALRDMELGSTSMTRRIFGFVPEK